MGLTKPPIRTEPVSCALKGSETSYWRNSPVPQQDTYRNRSSSDRLISVTSGGTTPRSFSMGGKMAGSAGSAGTSITLRMAHCSPSLCQTQTALERFCKLTTTPTKPYVCVGSCAGRSSSTIWLSSPRSSCWRCLRRRRSHI